MELRKESKTEMDMFNNRFLKSGKKYHVECNALGQITKVRSTDKDITKYAKELGLKQDG